jgi:N-methylhydantoinase B/oxoprolinase/acetone carboxylase alpha subunit
MHNNANIPIEMIESQMPLTITRYGLLPGSGGAGAHRGGLGLHREWRLDGPGGVFTANMDRFRFPPYGLAGGGPGSLGRLMRIRDGVATPIAPKSDGVRLQRGDIVRLETSGGGGFGDPAARDPAAAARDVALGYVAP